MSSKGLPGVVSRTHKNHSYQWMEFSKVTQAFRHVPKASLPSNSRFKNWFICSPTMRKLENRGLNGCIYTISSAMTVSVKWIEIENQTKKSNCKHHEVHYIVCYMLFNDFVCGVFSHTPNGLWFSGRPRGLLKVLHPQKREGVSV